MIKKIFFIFTTMIQFILIISAFILEMLSKKKMGIMRHFVYYNKKIENTYDMTLIINIASIAVLIVVIFSLILLLYNKKVQMHNNKYMSFLNSSLFICGILLFVFLQYFSRNVLLTYYCMSLVFFIVYIAEIIKAFIYLMTIKNKYK